MERHEIDVFLVLAEELHFGRTAERLYLSQARVSQTIKRLERRFGAPLFERTSRSVGITPLGRQLRADLLPVRAALDTAIERALDSARGVAGLVRVGYMSAMAAQMVADTAPVFRTRYPECALQIREVQISDIFGPLHRDEIDLVLSHTPDGEPNLVAGPILLSSPTGLLVPRGHRLARRSSIELAAASRDVLPIGGHATNYWHRYLERKWQLTASDQPPVLTFDELLTAVAAEGGVHPAGAQAGTHYPRHGVTYVPFEDGNPHVWRMVWSAGAENARVRAFAETACEVVADRGDLHYLTNRAAG